MESDDILPKHLLNKTDINSENINEKNGVCPTHPTSPNPFPCKLCHNKTKLVCRDYSDHQNNLQLIGLLPKNLGTSCYDCRIKNTKKCLVHERHAKSLCFNIECNEVVCNISYDVQGYSSLENNVVYCNKCYMLHKDSKDINVSFYKESLKNHKKSNTSITTTANDNLVTKEMNLVDYNVTTKGYDYSVSVITKANLITHSNVTKTSLILARPTNSSDLQMRGDYKTDSNGVNTVNSSVITKGPDCRVNKNKMGNHNTTSNVKKVSFSGDSNIVPVTEIKQYTNIEKDTKAGIMKACLMYDSKNCGSHKEQTHIDQIFLYSIP